MQPPACKSPACNLTVYLPHACSWAPTMGILGVPDLGPMGDKKADYAVFTVGAIVFSSKPAKAQTLLLTDNEGGHARARTSVFAG